MAQKYFYKNFEKVLDIFFDLWYLLLSQKKSNSTQASINPFPGRGCGCWTDIPAFPLFSIQRRNGCFDIDLFEASSQKVRLSL
jgi:hypothetical protein